VQPSKIEVHPVTVREPQVVELLDALTSELAVAGYTADQTFGYTVDQLQSTSVRMVGARVEGRLTGVGGLELQEDGVGELKRFFVTPEHRGTGVADALLDALLDCARRYELDRVRLETGDKQHAAIAFYRRHGFVEIPRFGPYVSSRTSVCMERAVGDKTANPPGGQAPVRSMFSPTASSASTAPAPTGQAELTEADGCDN
jgi:putative acetyltransferase